MKSLAESDIDALVVGAGVTGAGVALDAATRGLRVVLVAPLPASLGDQQAAMVGHVCLAPGEANNTYGTGNLLFLNRHRAGPLQERAAEHCVPPVRRSAAWLLPRRLDRGHRVRGAMSARPARTDPVCLAERDAGPRGGGQRRGVLRAGVPGLFAPCWRSDARGAIVGLSRFNTNAHIARATLEAICDQSRDVADAMEKDSGSRSRCSRSTVGDRQQPVHADPG